MGDITPLIETHEHRLMRAWMRRDARELRKFVARDFMMIVGATRPQLLDRPSFIAASEGAFTCKGFRFREVCVRKHGSTAWFTAGVDLELTLGRKDWSGAFWLTDLWRKTGIKRNWRLAERSLSRMEQDETMPQAIQQLQLWN